MAIKDDSDFDAEKFRKLVAHFDNANRSEAHNAFVLALNELSKIEDRAEAKRLRNELTEAFDLATRHDPEGTKKKDEINERLRQQEAGEDVDDWIPVADVPPAPPPRSDPPRAAPSRPVPPPPAPHGADEEEKITSLGFGRGVFWSAFFSFVCWSLFITLARQRPVTLDDWRESFTWGWTSVGMWLFFVPGGVYAVYKVGGAFDGIVLTGFPRFRAWCMAKLCSPNVATLTVVGSGLFLIVTTLIFHVSTGASH